MSARGYLGTRVSCRAGRGGVLTEIVIIAVSKLRSLCDRAISRLSHSPALSVYLTANANTPTAARIHIGDDKKKKCTLAVTPDTWMPIERM